MNVLCPGCDFSQEVKENTPVFECEKCGLTTNLSQIGTSPGLQAPVLLQDLSGQVIDGYKIDTLIGVGGMGVVYKATNDSGAVVALKMLSKEAEFGSGEKKDAFIARFSREIRALKKMDHPNIVKLLDNGQTGGVHYLVTEYVEGPNLAQYLREGLPSVDQSMRIMKGICKAIQYAHENGVVHRDIKPANVIVSESGIKVLDFGLAQLTGTDTQLTSLTRTDLAMGTFNYLSPEQRLNAKNVDRRADIFSMGVVFFEMLTGTLPLGHFETPSQIRKSLSKRVDGVIQKSLSANPENRYQSVDDLYKAISTMDNQKLLGVGAGVVSAGAGVFILMILGTLWFWLGNQGISEDKLPDGIIGNDFAGDLAGAEVKIEVPTKTMNSQPRQMKPDRMKPMNNSVQQSIKSAPAAKEQPIPKETEKPAGAADSQNKVPKNDGNKDLDGLLSKPSLKGNQNVSNGKTPKRKSRKTGSKKRTSVKGKSAMVDFLSEEARGERKQESMETSKGVQSSLDHKEIKKNTQKSKNSKKKSRKKKIEKFESAMGFEK